MRYSVQLLNFEFHKHPIPNAVLGIDFSWQIFKNTVFCKDFTVHVLTNPLIGIAVKLAFSEITYFVKAERLEVFANPVFRV